MLRGTEYDLKRGIITVLYVLLLAHFLFSNIAGVVPRNFHMVLNKSSTAEVQASCAQAGQAVPVNNDKKGFPFAIVKNVDCTESNFYLLAGLLNAVYIIAISLIFFLFRSNVLE